jgi:hypothetical protein
MSEPTTNAPPIVLIHGLWTTARSRDRWAQHYRAKGYEVVVPTYPGSRSRWRRCAKSPRSSPRHPPRNPRPSQRRGREPGPSADHHGPLLRRDLHPTPGQPRIGRRRRDDRLGATRGCAGEPAVPDQVPVPDPRQPGQPAPRGGLHPGAVPLCVRPHVQSGGVRRCVRPPPHPGARQLGVGLRPDSQLEAGPPGDLGRLRPGRPGAAAVHHGRRGPPE